MRTLLGALALAAVLLAPALGMAAPADVRGARFDGALVRDAYGQLASPSPGPAGEVARRYVEAHAEDLGLPQGGDLREDTVKRSLTATHHHFQQYWDGLPVVGGHVSVHVRPDGAVVAVHSGAVPAVAPLVEAVGAARAAALAEAAAPGVALRAEPVVYALDRQGRPAWEVAVEQRHPTEAWLVYIDRATGAVLAAEDQLQRFEGPANVWDSPIVHSMNPILEDNQLGLEKPPPGRDGHDFSQWYQPATLLDLAQGPRGARLEGPFVHIADGLAEGDDFRFPRDDPRFEEVNAYHWIDWTERLLQGLGFQDLGNFSLPVYAHDENGLHGAYFRPDDGHGSVHLGSRGAVATVNSGSSNALLDSLGDYLKVSDAGEDAEVVVHEYGHALFWDAEARAYGPVNEGFSDFLAASILSRVSGGAFDACIAEWYEHYLRGPSSGQPAISTCRRVIDNDMVATAENRDIYHHACQVYSGALWDLRKEMGGEPSEKLALEALFFMGDGELEVAAEALLMADLGLSGGAHARRIVDEFASRNVTGIVVTPDVLASLRAAAPLSLGAAGAERAVPAPWVLASLALAVGALAFRRHR